jgi:REP element-mobilizing transposase RayT
MIVGYHVIFGAYGFWLPNDPRGSWSNFVGSWELFRYGPATKTNERRSVAYQPHDQALRLAAKKALKRPAVEFNGQQARAVGMGFASYVQGSRLPVWACAILPDHVHLLVYLPEEGMLHRFNKLWRGRSGRKIAKLLDPKADEQALQTMAAHANGKAHYAVWKEQVRALAIWNQKKLHAMIDYIHHNPVRRKLVQSTVDWPYSSSRFYDNNQPAILPLTPPEP